jgi:hypothetical protein
MRLFFVWHGAAILCVIYMVLSAVLYGGFAYLALHQDEFRFAYLYYFVFVRIYKLFLNIFVPMRDRTHFLGIIGA